MFWRTGRLREALTTYQAMLEEYPFSFYTNYLAGNLLNAMGEKEEAMTYLRSSLRSNPDYLPAHLDLGLLEVNAGRYEEGEGHLRAVVQQAGTGSRSGSSEGECPLRPGSSRCQSRRDRPSP